MNKQLPRTPRDPVGGSGDLPAFDRGWSRTGGASKIGAGAVGGKAAGLLALRQILAKSIDPAAFPGMDVVVPTMVVLATDVFDAFLERNHLLDLVSGERDDARIARTFQDAELPVEIVGDLRALTNSVKHPLAVRSSSLLEDALFHPFAGVYETKMTPNNQPDPGTRFHKLAEAVKFVYASTFFQAARDYRQTLGDRGRGEKMAVVIQDVVGVRRYDRFYPNLSGVARSFNFYPRGDAPREDGIVELALGLGKSIVDEGVAYPYVPSRPKSPPPYSSVGELLKSTQREFWAVNMGRPPAFDPTSETEYLVRGDLGEAEYDGTLRYVASTYDPGSDRLWPGTARKGPRAVTFAPLLQTGELPLNSAIRSVIVAGREALGTDVEIEFAMSFPTPDQQDLPRLGFVQIRSMATPQEHVEVDETSLEEPGLLFGSRRSLGNGIYEGIRDVVYTPPDRFDPSRTRQVSEALGVLNRTMIAESRPYVLVGFGRWGSSDPWLGIPVKWGQVSGAKIIVEANLPDRPIEISQGSHFIHNLTSFQVSYLQVTGDDPPIDWSGLSSTAAIQESEFIRHVRFENPLRIRVDGRSGRGGVWR